MKRVRYFPGQQACYLTVALAERETDPVGDPATFTRIEEGAVALARLVRSRRGWRVDSRYRPRRAR